MIEISKNEFLSKIDEDIRHETITDIRGALEEVWEQATGQALYDAEVRRLQHEFGKAVMRAGGPESVAKRAGTVAEIIKRWIVRPMDMTLSEMRRLQHATGFTLSFEVLDPIDPED